MAKDSNAFEKDFALNYGSPIIDKNDYQQNGPEQQRRYLRPGRLTQ